MKSHSEVYQRNVLESAISLQKCTVTLGFQFRSSVLTESQEGRYPCQHFTMLLFAFLTICICVACVFTIVRFLLERCNPSPTCRQSPSSQLFLAPTALADSARGARSPRSHYDFILVMTSFATDLATPSVTDVTYVRTYGHLTAFNI